LSPAVPFCNLALHDRPLQSTAIKVKGVLFLLIGLLSAVLIILEHPTLKLALLLALTIWCFCRFYYFAFYVIEKYVDPNFRFAGLLSFARYMISRRTPKS
jgi:hypothetical protein